LRVDRIGTGLTAMATLIWVLWPDQGWTLDGEPTVAFVLALGAWLWREFSDTPAESVTSPLDAVSRTIHPHDVQLAKRIREAFDENTKRFLREHGFGVTFREDALKNILGVADNWKGVDYEFMDKDLDNKLFEVVRHCRTLAEKTAEYAGYTRSGRRLAVPTEQERVSDSFSELTIARVRELDDLATKTLEAYEALEKEFRLRLPELYAG
jgi:hypothetical protein